MLILTPRTWELAQLTPPVGPEGPHFSSLVQLRVAHSEEPIICGLYDRTGESSRQTISVWKSRIVSEASAQKGGLEKFLEEAVFCSAGENQKGLAWTHEAGLTLEERAVVFAVSPGPPFVLA